MKSLRPLSISSSLLILLVCVVDHVFGGVNPFDIDVKAQFGRVCAIGDFNGDRLADILVQRDEKTLVILKQLETGSFENYTELILSPIAPDGKNVFCSVGDFNGDSELDILVSHKTDKAYRLTLFKNEGDGTYKKVEGFDKTVFSEPITWDLNGDGLSEILSFHENGSRFCWLGNELLKDQPCTHYFLESEPLPDAPVLHPFPGMPHLLIDIDGDLSAEIIFIMQDEKKRPHFQVWRRPRFDPDADVQTLHMNTKWVIDVDRIPKISPDFQYFAAPVVGDFDSDQKMEIGLPVCKDDDCAVVTHFLIWRYGMTSWNSYSMDMPELTLVRDGESRVVFRLGDFNLDGYPDLVATFLSANRNKTYVKVIDNEECKDCGSMTRRFNIRRGSHFVEPWELALGRATLSTFFDLKEDGNLDILVEYDYPQKEDKSTIDKKFTFILSDEKGDTTFLKVQTYTPVCNTRCRKNDKDIGSGIAWPGVCVSFTMTDSWIGKKEGVSCQQPLATQRSLPTPYVLFGLGRAPNFVDLVTVGGPRTAGKDKHHVYMSQRGEFKQIVPNSRVIVIPPKDWAVDHWLSRLYVTPSQLIIQSLIVLASVCLLLLMVVIILHVREKKEDRVERQAQSHRFHFDAM